MKRIYTIIAGVMLTANVLAQAPEKMSYQAVIRDVSNNLIANQAIGMQISILQGGVTGFAVYTETQSPTTNVNGLVSIEIGTGIPIGINFSAIDWSNGPYFIKTETDPTTAGGSNYTISGTSQLISVPYALHAKTAESVTGSIIENDPVYATSPSASITSTDIANWNNDSVNVYHAGNGISIVNDTISATEPTYSLGVNPSLGGCVFYLTPNQKHGLVITTNFQGQGTWYAAVDSISNPVNYNSIGKQFTDWRLPTIHEINIVYNSGCSNELGWYNYMWTAQEINSSNANAIYSPGPTPISYAKTTTQYIKAVRSF